MEVTVVENLATGEADLIIHKLDEDTLDRIDRCNNIRVFICDSEELAYNYIDHVIEGGDLRLETDSDKRSKLLRALKSSNWKQSEAAKLLGVSPRAINYLCTKFSIVHENWPRKNGKGEYHEQLV